jgi:hypothetical protein
MLPAALRPPSGILTVVGSISEFVLKETAHEVIKP